MKDEQIKELIEAAKGVLEYLELPGEMKYVNALYIPPAEQLRVQADKLDKQGAAIKRFRAAVKGIDD